MSPCAVMEAADLDRALTSCLRRASPLALLDLVVVRRTGSLLAFRVGGPWAGTSARERGPGAFRSFQSLASRRYCDTDKLRRAQRRSIHAFLERQGLEYVRSTPPSFAASWPDRRLAGRAGAPRPAHYFRVPGTSLRAEGRRAIAPRRYRGGAGRQRAPDRGAGVAEVPNNYYGGFVKLGDLGVLPRELSRSLAPSAGLRNRLVHEYGLNPSTTPRCWLPIGALLASVPVLRAGRRVLPDQGGRLERG